MLFNTYEFIACFVPLLLLGFYVLGRCGMGRGALGFLTLGSFFFYGYWSLTYLFLLLGSICVNYVLGRRLSDGGGRGWLWAGICFNLSLIAYFKYANFFVGQLPDSWGFVRGWHPVLLPLAISFFTFQQVAYLVDAWQGKCRAYRFLDYCLFVSFFPQLIAGPIVHHEEMMPQFQSHGFSLGSERAARGLTWFVLGLFKKVVLADGVARFSTPVFDAALGGGSTTFFEAWGGVLAYTAQIYFDFSGYSDMAMGLGYLFGVELPLNFNSPYKARSMSDFWRRWHMTLSRFLRDYLYIPLGGNRKGEVRRYVNLGLTMLLGGLWHGAAWTYVIWGVLHGVFLMLDHAWVAWRGREGVGMRFGGLGTFFGVVVAWVVFRAESLEAALGLYRGMLGLNGVSLSDNAEGLLGGLGVLGLRFEGMGAFDSDGILWVVVCLLIAFFAPNTQELMGRVEGVRSRVRFVWRPSFFWSAVVAVLAVWSLLQLSEVSEFLYFQF